MKILRALALPALALAVAAPVYAGGAECQKAAQAANHTGKKCNMSAEECKRYMEGMKTAGYLGIDADDSDGSIRIKKVYEGSPAAKAGFQTGDVLVALNGVAFGEENQDKIKAIKKNLKPGSEATYTIARGGSKTELHATLGRMPEEVYQAMVAEHMKEHVEVASK